MPLVCQYCGVPLFSEHINYDAGIAKCRQCGAIFGVTPRPSASPSGPESAQRLFSSPPVVTRPRSKISRPARLRYTKTAQGDLKFYRRWWSAEQWGGWLVRVFLAGVWNGLALWINLVAWPARAGWWLGWCAVSVTLVGFGWLYWVAVTVVNGTTLWANRQHLWVTQGPLARSRQGPWAVADLRQLYTRPAFTRDPDQRPRRADGTRLQNYELRAVLRTGDEITLLEGVTEPNELLFIEQQLERAFGWEDEAMVEEIPRTGVYN